MDVISVDRKKCGNFLKFSVTDMVFGSKSIEPNGFKTDKNKRKLDCDQISEHFVQNISIRFKPFF